MECCKRPPKMPSKTGVSRAEVVAHAFERSIASVPTHSPATWPAMRQSRFRAGLGGPFRQRTYRRLSSPAMTAKTMPAVATKNLIIPIAIVPR